MSYVSLIEHLIFPLITHQEDLRVKEFPSEDDSTLFQVMVHQDDLGRVIGKQGKTINAIRTIIYAAGAKDGKKVRINVDSY